ncbi:MAG TPA: hypothetical protein VIW64_12660 [Pyrinomonadaceae bacterium]|jgi:NTP pyrophosphatase (non-canonical NTP hydrolase)
MTRIEILLECLAEECAEVIQRVTKAQRFGLDEIQPGQSLTNERRVNYELCDLVTIVSMLEELGVALYPDVSAEKRVKVEKHLELSRTLGRLEE